MLPSAPPSASAPDSAGWLRRLRGRHFHDYSQAAFVLWALVAASGLAALVGSLVGLARAPGSSLGPLLAGLILVVAAAWWTIKIPRSKYSFSASDAFVFGILASLGPAAAVLAAGVDGLVGSLRSTQRLTSRVSTPASAMAAMALCGLAFEAIVGRLTGAGLHDPVARLAALVCVAWIPFVLTHLAMMSIVTLKRGHWPDLGEWFRSYSWVAAVAFASAAVAGLVQTSALEHGPTALVITAVAVLIVVALLRITIANTEAEHRLQEARVAAAEQEAALTQRRFAAAFSEAAIGMAIADGAGRVVRVNAALCELLETDAAGLVGEPFSRLLHPEDLAHFEQRFQSFAARPDADPVRIDLRCQPRSDREVWMSVHCGRFRDEGSQDEGFIFQLLDITARRLAEKRLEHIAFHDSLTGLANRARFNELLAEAVEASRLDPGFAFAVLFLDLDRFKIVNDSLGHLAGNELLREIARRLREGLPGSVLVARLGGDEFGILQTHLESTEAGLATARRVLDVLAPPLSIQGHEIAPSASVGVTFSDLGYRTVDELLRDADLAMYEAKSAGRNRLAVFDRTMHERIADKLALEAELRRAIGDGELLLCLQPIYTLDRHELAGFEALIRWQHPIRGLIGPAVFVPLAEETGYIQVLTQWIVDTSVGQLAAWHRLHPGAAGVTINVNVSGRDLQEPGFVDLVLDTLKRHRVQPQLLTLEITESVLMGQIQGSREILERLRAQGVKVAIDDFGTGYSSLSYLGSLPIDCLKIDRSFVSALGEAGHQEIVQAVLTLGRALALKVVAEGIETESQLSMLRDMGVHAGQGYWLAEPLHPEAVPALLRSARLVPVDAAALPPG